MDRWLRWARLVSFTIGFSLILGTVAYVFSRRAGGTMPGALVAAIFVFGFLIPFAMKAVTGIRRTRDVIREARLASSYPSAPRVDAFAPPPAPPSRVPAPAAPIERGTDGRTRLHAWLRRGALVSFLIGVGVFVVPIAYHLSQGTPSQIDPPMGLFLLFGMAIPFVLTTIGKAERLVDADRPRRRTGPPASSGPFEPPPPGPPPIDPI